MSAKFELGDAPIETRFNATMNAIAKVIDRAFNGKLRRKNREVGFVLLVFPFTKDGVATTKQDRCNFISNGADRNDIVVLFKEMIARFEGQAQQQTETRQ